VVVGSGAAGLTAAILAHDNGAKVIILERSDKVGGTTAVSGGGVWLPLNHHIDNSGISDSREDALNYCQRLVLGRADAKLVETFVDRGAEMLAYIEGNTPLKFSPMSAPDYRPEDNGGKMRGRSIEPLLFNKRELGDWEERLRGSGIFLFPVRLEEIFATYQAFYRPQNIPMDIVVERMERGEVACGQAIVAPLLKACLDRKISLLLETRARRLVIEAGRVTGVEADGGDETMRFKGRRGVILASGGFEWNERLKAKFLPGQVPYPNSPPFNEGDGLVMAMEIGADLANMTEIWGYPTAVMPGEEYENKPLGRPIKAERTAPHSIMVNRYGRRFVNEAANYNDLAKTLNSFDANAFGYMNLPCWAIFDAQYRERYSILTVLPSDPDPNWLPRKDNLDELATEVGIDPNGLTSTVNRWNEMVRSGRDEDFNRGESAFDRYQGDKDAAHPSLGTIERPPFYALPIYPGTLGTKGGPRTNEKGEVLNVRGQVIRGLYAAGNVAASITGPAYFGAGGTIGPAMTWGYICGINAATAS
jgi:succinate dehydrogenase/fumarate reductase flavoprotein subunit